MDLERQGPAARSPTLAFTTGTISFTQGFSRGSSSEAIFGVSGMINDPVLGEMLNGDAFAFQGGTQWGVFGSNTYPGYTGMYIYPQLGDVQEFLLPDYAITVAGFSGAPYLRARKLEILLHQPCVGIELCRDVAHQYKMVGREPYGQHCQ